MKPCSYVIVNYLLYKHTDFAPQLVVIHFLEYCSILEIGQCRKPSQHETLLQSGTVPYNTRSEESWAAVQAIFDAQWIVIVKVFPIDY